MKKFVIFTTCIFCAILYSCSVGSYSVSSGNPDEAYLTFVSSSAYDITIDVDGQTYNCKTVKEIPHKQRRDIKKTAQNTITMKPGTHQVNVFANGVQKYSQKVFVSASETKIIKL